MTTPIYDFVQGCADSGSLRAHMPGHKGVPVLGCEPLDITEIAGADELFDPRGIILESQQNAGRLFGAETFYSAEGSSLPIRAMMYLAMLYSQSRGKRAKIAAGRNVHKTFITAAALLDFEIVWLYPNEGSYLSCQLDPKELDRLLTNQPDICAVYITSPDYLGNIQRHMEELAEICRSHGALLIVDNAHGAYLKFLRPSLHPMDLGADMCCDSAHKTLPVLTGGAYLHISPKADPILSQNALTAMSLFASTSPSYLILQSLDLANRYLAEHGEDYPRFEARMSDFKHRLRDLGFVLIGDEPGKVTISAKKNGWTGQEMAAQLEKKGIFCEFSDPDFLVLMLSPQNGEEEPDRLESALRALPKRPSITTKPPELTKARRAMTVRQAAFAPWETVSPERAAGRISAQLTASCPPAVPITVCGEMIDRAAAEAMRYYGLDTVRVVKE